LININVNIIMMMIIIMSIIGIITFIFIMTSLRRHHDARIRVPRTGGLYSALTVAFGLVSTQQLYGLQSRPVIPAQECIQNRVMQVPK
jgi:hypothetical protein